ncbi:MAG: NUDIX hydrolase [Candidatus Omnitrophica bacterium]|nr:NUDIX hydrolase [Candidatus Omnitrophota bacterium]
MQKIVRYKTKKIVLKKGRFINFVSRGGWEYIERNNCSGAVIIVAVTNDQQVLFVEQYRPPVDRYVIEFPAGLIDDLNTKKKETCVQAAKRELLEETGYQAKMIKKLIHGPAACGTSSDLLTMVLATGLKKVHDGGGDELESIVTHVVPLSGVEDWLKRMERKGYLIGTRLYAGLYFLNKYNNTKSIK